MAFSLLPHHPACKGGGQSVPVFSKGHNPYLGGPGSQQATFAKTPGKHTVGLKSAGLLSLRWPQVTPGDNVAKTQETTDMSPARQRVLQEAVETKQSGGAGPELAGLGRDGSGHRGGGRAPSSRSWNPQHPGASSGTRSLTSLQLSTWSRPPYTGWHQGLRGTQTWSSSWSPGMRQEAGCQTPECNRAGLGSGGPEGHIWEPGTQFQPRKEEGRGGHYQPLGKDWACRGSGARPQGSHQVGHSLWG